MKRRMHRHGWRETQDSSGGSVRKNLKNNKTKAI